MCARSCSQVRVGIVLEFVLLQSEYCSYSKSIARDDFKVFCPQGNSGLQMFSVGEQAFLQTCLTLMCFHFSVVTESFQKIDPKQLNFVFFFYKCSLRFPANLSHIDVFSLGTFSCCNRVVPRDRFKTT